RRPPAVIAPRTTGPARRRLHARRGMPPCSRCAPAPMPHRCAYGSTAARTSTTVRAPAISARPGGGGTPARPRPSPLAIARHMANVADDHMLIPTEAAMPTIALPPRLRLACIALLLACCGIAHAAEPVAASPQARVRVAFDRDGITSTRTDGYDDPATKRAVSIDDPVRIASISKLVLTIGVMRLVEEGRLDLDADVSGALGWKLRNPNFPDVPITLRLLLSHTSSLTDGAGYWQVPLDGEFRTLLDDPKAWDAEHAPGRYWRYANVGFPLVGAAMERATGERLDLLMQRLVIQPLGLHACYGWPTCDEATAARAVVLYAEGKPEVDDNRGRKPACGITPASDGSCDLSKWRAG